MAHCESLKDIQYKIEDRNFYDSNIFTDLNALTNYTIVVRATNNINLSTDNILYVRTGELGMFHNLGNK